MNGNADFILNNENLVLGYSVRRLFTGLAKAAFIE